MSYKSLVQVIKEHNTPVELLEIQQKEVDALKKLSKDMQSVLKGYQSIVKMGDKELKDSKYNKDYEAVLKARDTIFSLIGKVNTQKILNKEEVEVIEEDLMVEMIDINKARELPDDVQKQIKDAKKEYDSKWSGVFVPMGKDGSSQRKEYEKRGKEFKAASAKYKALLTKHKVMTK